MSFTSFFSTVGDELIIDRRLSELEHETDELREKLRSSQNVNPQHSPMNMLTAAAELGVHSRSNRASMRLSPPPPPPSISNYSQQMVSPVCLGPSLPRITDDTEDRSAGPTSPQTLNGITVTGEEIDEIFQLYVYTQ